MKSRTDNSLKRSKLTDMGKFIWFLVVSYICGLSSAEKILMLVSAPTKSHHNLVEKLAEDLAVRGHQVTLVTAFKRTTPLKNLEEVIYPNYYDTLMESFKGPSQNILELQMNPLGSLLALNHMGLVMTETFLSTPVIKEFIRSQRKYDVVIGETFFAEAALAGFANKYDAHLIGLCPTFASFFANYMVGNPSPSSYVPSSVLGYSEKMTMFERFKNFWYENFAWAYFQGIYLPQQGSVLEKHFGIPQSRIRSLMTNTSLVLVNHHYSLAFPRPYVPNMIEIGGYHVRPVKELPNELKSYLDQSKQGVILFSMGSHLRSANFPREKLVLFLKTFARLKQNVLWKFEDDSLPDLPRNVKIMKWLPQSDVLAHPNIKLFITHGGLLSNIETVLRGVPLLGLPVLGDQPANMLFAENAGYGKMLSLADLTEDSFYNGITEILSNKMYYDNVKRRSLTLKDGPMSAKDKAIYWVEYVIRHKGAPHLRSNSLDLFWFQLYNFDIILISLILVYCFWKISAKIFTAVFCRKSTKTSKTKSE